MSENVITKLIISSKQQQHLHLVLLREAKKMEVNNEIDSDNEIKTLLLKILKKLSNKSYKKSPNFIRTKDRHRITYVLAS